MIVARHLVAIAILLAASSAVKGQVEVAPPPHPTIDEVVKEYLRLKIPLPPKDAELVVVREPWTHALESGISREFVFRSGRAAVPAEQQFFSVGRPYYGDY